MKKVLSIGYGSIGDIYDLKEDLSSRHFYGLVELKAKYQIRQLTLSSQGGWRSFIRNNLASLAPCDIVYMGYLYVAPLLLLAVLKHLGIRRPLIVVVCHHTLGRPSGLLSRWLFRLVYSAIDQFLFHSAKNMDESIASGMVSPQRAAYFDWGEDIGFIDRHYQPSDGGYFISTGRENRDFRLLVEAFSQAGARLELYTNARNVDNDYTYLSQQQGRHPAVRIEFVTHGKDIFRMLGERTAGSRCVVVPLLKKRVDYCLGLTSIVEAMAMGKPIISSPNPYSPIDLEAEGIGFYADSVDDWVRYIQYLDQHPDVAASMGRKARRLAEDRYNINSLATKLDQIWSTK